MRSLHSQTACQHCGTMVPQHASDPRFCCRGCAYVHDLLLDQGLAKFYDLRAGQTLTPVAPEALRPRNDAWLVERVQQAEEMAPPEGTASLELAVQGMSCIGCVWLLQKVFLSHPGAVHLDVHMSRGEMHLTWQPGLMDVPGFTAQLQQFGYLAGPAGDAQLDSVQSAAFGRKVGLCGAFAMNAMAFSLPSYLGMGQDFLFASWFDIIAACSATLSLLVGGSYFMERSWLALRQRVLHMDTPIALGILLAWMGSMVGWLTGETALKYFDFVSLFVFLMLVGRWLQQGAVERNRRRLLKSSAIPEYVLCRKGETLEKRVRLEAIATGDVLHISPGGICPVAGVLVESNQASLSLEWINGESSAATRSRGQSVPSGALNIGAQVMRVQATEVWEHSLLHRLDAAGHGETSSGVSNPLLRGYLVAVLLLGVGGGIARWWAGHGFGDALQVMISVFVVSCPCALGVAAPYADDLAASLMERLGVFVRSTSLWARLRKVRTIIFDKTGTLTLENPALTNPEAVAGLDEEAKKALHHLVSCNLHPVSRSLFDAVGPLSKTSNPVTPGPAIEEVVGQGMMFTDGQGRLWSLGRPGWRGGIRSNPLETSEDDAELACNGRPRAVFRFADTIRPETLRACERLREQRCGLYLLSGDRSAKVRAVAGQLGIPADHWQGEMTPQEKADQVAALDHSNTLYVGDGANDSLALQAAFCSGSPVTGRNFLEHRADFYFLGNSLRFVPDLLRVAVLRARAVRRVFVFALSYNAVAVALSLGGWMSPLLAAVLMPLSSLCTLGLVGLTFRRWRALPDSRQEQRGMPQLMRRAPGPVPL